MRLEDAEFYALVERDGLLKPINVFASSDVRWAIARYKTSKITRERWGDKAFFYFFNHYWSRSQYELIVQSWPQGRLEEKVDVYSMLKINEQLIWDIINKITIKSCREFNKQWRLKHAKNGNA